MSKRHCFPSFVSIVDGQILHLRTINNAHGHVLLTEVVKETTSQNRLTEAVTFNVTASVNTTIFRGGHVTKNHLS